MLSILGLLAASILCLCSNLSSAQDGQCTTSQYRSVSSTRFETVSFSYTSSCGFLWLSRCRRTKYARVSRLVYQVQNIGVLTECCSGYRATSRNICEPICDGACESPQYCESPGNCICIEGGFTGPNCKTPVCSSGCPSPRVCVAPDSCQCNAGYTGQTCTEDINECVVVEDPGCEQVCINHQGSYSCGCNADFVLADDSVSCIGKVNISLTTVNSSSLVIAWMYPEWDTGRMTVSYNITCSRNDSNTTLSSSSVINAENNDTMLNLNTSEGYTCCAAVMTQDGVGPQSCSQVQPIPVTTEDPKVVPNVATDADSVHKDGVLSSTTFIVGVSAGGGAVGLLLFVLAVLVLCCCIYNRRNSRSKMILSPNQVPLSSVGSDDDRDYDNELYSMPGSDTLKKSDMGDEKTVQIPSNDDLVYNSMYSGGTAADNDYETVQATQYHYVQYQ